MSSDSNAEVRLSNSPEAPLIRVEEEDIRDRYPWDYRNLSRRLRRRYRDFKEDTAYHKIRKGLEADARYCKERLLDPGNPRSTKKKFYNSNIIREFDKHYTRADTVGQ